MAKSILSIINELKTQISKLVEERDQANEALAELLESVSTGNKPTKRATKGPKTIMTTGDRTFEALDHIQKGQDSVVKLIAAMGVGKQSVDNYVRVLKKAHKISVEGRGEAKTFKAK